MTEPHFPDILIWAIPFFIVCIGLELLWLKYHPIKNAYTFKDGAASLIMGSGMSLFDIATKAFNLIFLLWVWQFRALDLQNHMNLIWVVLIALFADDFMYYWKHFLYHKSRWFWATHVVHHSSEHYNLTTALRQPWTNIISGTVLLSVPLVLLGIHPLILFFVGALNLLYQFWFHTETIDKMPKWFEFLLNTPSHHRVHHGRNPRYLDANFAGIFIIWDRLFGTFVPELEDEKVDYGIVKPLTTFNPFIIAFHEFAAIAKDVFSKGPNLGQRIKYIFAPPGYSHNQSRKTVSQIKAAYLEKHPDQNGSAGFPKS
ncbi:MAG: sterol desaturase family protein [Robiginitomaculum sp.]|nr:sterol desaturase family protein [Robiginitomaculum sp.]